MKVDASVMGARLTDVARVARELEDMGYDGCFSAETSHDPFLPLALVAEHTSRVDIGTGITVAFGRSPMTVANAAHDLQLMSEGRMILGLGSQIKPHIEKRFSMPWSHPAARMREYVLALRAIWASWNEGVPLQFRGEFYHHTLMTPMFSPPASSWGPPKVFVAAVGDLMTQAAGEVADGMIVHGFTTERYIREVTLPALERGLAKAGRSRDAVQVVGPVFIVTAADEAAFATAKQAAKQQLAFYGSTPAYRPVLDLHGWGDAQGELNVLSKEGKWVEMADLFDDEMLETFAVVGEPEEIPRKLVERYGDIVDRVSVTFRHTDDPDRWRGVIAAIRRES